MKPKKGQESKTKVIQGYIIREDKPVQAPEEVYSDEEDEYYELVGDYVQKATVYKTKVMMQTIDTDGDLASVIYVHGKFPYQGQWWLITVEVKQMHDSWYSQGLPSYRLREDLSSKKQILNTLVDVALSSEKVTGMAQSTEISIFKSFINSRVFTDYTPLYRIDRLTQLITECAEQRPTIPEKHAVLALIPHLHNSTELQEVNLAINCPVSMLKLPQIHPRAAPSILKCGMADPTFMNKVEMMIVHSPHELAFRPIIKRKTGRIFREATYQNFEKAELWAGLQQPYRDAVIVYCVLKEHCYGTGDTYMNVHRLNGQTPRYKGYTLTHFRPAIEYLISNHCVMEEDSRVYVKSLYESEVNIASTLSHMVSNDEHFTFPVDFTSQPLDVLAGDSDQREAVEMLSTKAVLVLSGRGGCGKTEVVSRACRVALSTYYKLKNREYEEYIKRCVQSEINRANETLLGNSTMNETCEQESVDESAFTSTDKAINPSPDSVRADNSKETRAEKYNESGGDLFDSSCDADESSEEVTALKSKEEQLSSCGEQSLNMLSNLWEDEQLAPPIPDETHRSYILLTAPTAKAAKVLGRRTGFTGYTIHQIMFRYVQWMKQAPPREPFPFNRVAILVVDECSLVAVSKISFLLDILKRHSDLQRVILLGDLLQLPSIEPGNFLPDVYAALSCRGCAITLHTNHRAEGRLIVENATRISRQCLPLFDEQRAFTYMQLKDADHVLLERDEAVKHLIGTEAFKSDKVSQFVAFRRIDCEAINNICSKVYTGHLCIDASTKRATFQEGFKISCGKNGTVRVVILHDPNNEAKEHVAPQANVDGTSASQRPSTAGEMTSEEELARRRKEMIEEKISIHIQRAQQQSESGIISENAQAEIEKKISNDEDLNSQLSEGGKEKSVKSCHMRLCNGELFWIKAMFMEKGVKFDKERWVLESEDGMTISVYRSEIMKECRMRPSWCRTIHTFQGSEINHLAYVVGAAGRQNWQHVYTAVTRGKHSVTVIGEDLSLRKSINTAAERRFCSLEEKLKEAMGVPVEKTTPELEKRKQPAVEFMTGTQALSQQSRQYVSDDQYEQMIEEEKIWGDDSTASQPLAANARKKQKLDAEDAFTQLDQFQQTFNQRISHSVPLNDLGFSSEDEDFILASQHMDRVKAGRNTGRTGETSEDIKVVQCQVLHSEENGRAVIVPLT